jgi:hypothetical protein
MVGRLLPYVEREGVIPAVQQFISSIVGGAPRPWPRPLQPALSPPGTSLVRLADDMTEHSFPPYQTRAGV